MKYDFKTLISILIIISFLIPTPIMAKLTPKHIKEEDKKVEVITIKKGDTLWDLAKLYYNDPFMWKKFEEFNIITDPNLIFPGEKLVISAEDAKKLKEILKERAIEVKEKIKEAEAKEKVVIKEVIKVEEVKVPVEVKDPVQDKALLEKLARLEQEVERLEQEVKLLEGEKSKTKEEKETVELREQVSYLKKEEEMLRKSIIELEEKLSGEKAEVTKLRKGKQEAEDLSHFLTVGAMCGFIILNAFK